MELPIIDMAPLFGAEATPAKADIASALRAACRDTGFFYARGHGIPETLIADLEAAARRFFALPEADKAKIAMTHGGGAWRGWFPLNGELTSGVPDRKEGLYLGTELGPDDPRVRAGVPLHGANLFPESVPKLRGLVLEFLERGARAAQALMAGIAESLDLPAGYFSARLTADPTVLFRIFRYPPAEAGDTAWGVGEHTDYGLLTLLVQDTSGGLQVKGRDGWIEAPPIPGTLVCNIGDMLDRLTGGWYRSTPHRVRNTSGHERISFPLFFDPGFTTAIQPLPDRASEPDDAEARWDRSSVHAFEGTYGDYLLDKVGKVFPELKKAALAGAR